MNPAATHLLDRFLWFDRGGTRFGAIMEHLQEVLPLTGLRPLPGAEPFVAGLMVLRESILPVFDPALWVDSAPPSRNGSVHAIVLRFEGRPVFAVVAEEVGQVVPLPARSKLSSRVKLAAAFAGELVTPGQKPLLILDVPGFAAAMGLHPAPAALSAAAAEFSPTTQLQQKTA